MQTPSVTAGVHILARPLGEFPTESGERVQYPKMRTDLLIYLCSFALSVTLRAPPLPKGEAFFRFVADETLPLRIAPLLPPNPSLQYKAGCTRGASRRFEFPGICVALWSRFRQIPFSLVSTRIACICAAEEVSVAAGRRRASTITKVKPPPEISAISTLMVC